MYTYLAGDIYIPVVFRRVTMILYNMQKVCRPSKSQVVSSRQLCVYVCRQLTISTLLRLLVFYMYQQCMYLPYIQLWYLGNQKFIHNYQNALGIKNFQYTYTPLALATNRVLYYLEQSILPYLPLATRLAYISTVYTNYLVYLHYTYQYIRLVQSKVEHIECLINKNSWQKQSTYIQIYSRNMYPSIYRIYHVRNRLQPDQ